MDRLFFALGSLSALIAVALGAFAAHGLKARLGAITPFGGAALLAGWLCLAWAAWKA